MNDIKLLGKKIIADKSKILLDYKPGPDWREYFVPKTGEWYQENDYFVGIERGNTGGIMLTKDYYEQDVMLSFTVSTILPATRDLNAVFCTKWIDEVNYLGESYVCGLNGWYENKAGLEKNGTPLYSTTNLYKYTPGTEVRMTCGAIDGHSFMVVDDVLVSELIDPEPIKGGYVGFSAYCTMLKIKDIEVREIYWEPFRQKYDPEF